MTLYCVCHDDEQADWWGMHGWPTLAVFSSKEKAKQKEELQQNCPNIEWEQDMGAHIPFCRLTNDFCDYHCM